MYTCVSCGEPSALAFDACPSCETFGTCIVADGGASGDGAPSPLARARRHLVPLTDVRPRFTERIPCCEPWASLLAGPGGPGLPVGRTIVVFGPGGSGKTTELLRLASSVPGSVFLPLEPEQEAGSLVEMANRLELDLSRMLTYDDDERPDLDDVARELSAGDHPLVIADSLNSFDDDPVKTVRTLRAASGRACLILVSHVNKQGRMSGREKLTHDVSATIKISRTTIRVLKARFCPSGSVRRSSAPAVVRSRP